jgi:mobilization protein NikA
VEIGTGIRSSVIAACFEVSYPVHVQHRHIKESDVAAATERIPVLVTAKEKTQIARMARAAGMSMGEFLRRAAASFRPSEDDKVLEAMIEQMAKSTARASAAIDEALAFVDASNKRISVLEARSKVA